MSRERDTKETRKSRSPSPKKESQKPPKKSRSRSRSAKRSEKKRSRSRSNKKSSRGRDRSRSRGKRDDRRGSARGRDDRDKPTPSEILGVFGLSPKTDQALLEDIFGQHGKLDKVVLITDRSTGMSRGFGFLYFKSIDDATKAKEACDGMTIDGRKIRTDYSLTHKAHEPTPGKYLGKSTRREYDRDRDHRRDDRDHDRRRDSRDRDRDRRDSSRDRYRPRERSGSPRYERYTGPGSGRDH